MDGRIKDAIIQQLTGAGLQEADSEIVDAYEASAGTSRVSRRVTVLPRASPRS